MPTGPLTSPEPDFYSAGYNEIVVAAAEGAFVDTCGYPRSLEFKPGDDVLALLESEGLFTVRTTPTLLDEMPAVIASFDARCYYDHLHFDENWTMRLSDRQTRTYVVTVEEKTIFIQIWPFTTVGNDAWSSVAEDIVQSIDFGGS
jgi:hypothetical protein